MEVVKIVFSVLIFLGYPFKFLTRAEDLFENVKIRHYTGLNTNYRAYGLKEASKIKLDANKPTVLYIHGWTHNVDNSKTPVQVVNSFLKRNEHNVCVLNYKDWAQKFYTILVDNVPRLSEKVAAALQKWIENGVDPSLIHLVGQSLGAHICGLIGRNLVAVGYVLGRITGLDPANPQYCTNGNTPHQNALKKIDAGFVDVIHTDGGFIGCMLPLGDADFYPNEGIRPQSMCGNSFTEFLNMLFDVYCSHDAAAVYFVNSVLSNGPIYLSTNRQNKKLTASMGYHCSYSAMGSYDLVID